MKPMHRFHQAARGLTSEGKNNIRILRGWTKRPHITSKGLDNNFAPININYVFSFKSNLFESFR